MLREHAVAAEDSVRLRPCARARMQEWTRRAEFAFEKTQALVFAPLLPLAAVETRCTHELHERLCVKCGVLPDVEMREVKTEDFECALHGLDIADREPLCAALDERGVEHCEIGGEFSGVLVEGGSFAELRALAGCEFDGQACEHETDELPPRFLQMCSEYGCCEFAERVGETSDAFAQRTRRRLHPRREREFSRELCEVAMVD